MSVPKSDAEQRKRKMQKTCKCSALSIGASRVTLLLIEAENPSCLPALHLTVSQYRLQEVQVKECTSVHKC